MIIGSVSMPTLLAQQGATIDVALQFTLVLDAILTPTGIVIAMLGTAFFIFLALSRFGFRIMIVLILFMLTMMKVDERFADNTLIQPFQQIRFYSRPLCLTLLILAAGRVALTNRGNRLRVLSFAGLAFLFFQLCYASEVALFYDLPRGGFGVISISLMFFVFFVGSGRFMQDRESAIAAVRLVAFAGFLFLGANLLQLALGYSQAIAQKRLSGISGNPQQLASLCSIFLITNIFLYSVSSVGSVLKWIYPFSIGLLSTFLVWSGSRSGVLTAIAGVLLFYRLRVGRLALLAILTAASAGVFVTVFSDSSENIERFVYGKNTREAVWSIAWSEFLDSPIIGQLPRYQTGEPNGVESSYLRTLALMGVLGGCILAVPVVSMVVNMLTAILVRQQRPEVGPVADLVVASLGSILITNALEGFFFGLLTFQVIFIYIVLALAAFVCEYPSLPDDNVDESDSITEAGQVA